MNKIVNFRKAVAALVFFLVLAAIHLLINSQNVSLNYQITDIKMKLNELTSQNRSLGGQAARQEDLTEVEKIAKAKLGMIYPDNINYLSGSGEAKAPATN